LKQAVLNIRKILYCACRKPNANGRFTNINRQKKLLFVNKCKYIINIIIIITNIIVKCFAQGIKSYIPATKNIFRVYNCKIKYRIAMAKAAFNKNRSLFTSTVDLELRKKLVKCYVWSTALYGAETWTLRLVDQKHLESFEMWC